MARSPSEATRFTSTGPYASTFTGNPGATSAGTQIDFGSAPAGETAQQKIARLRAAAALAKRGNESSFDKTVRVGRKWADRAHRVTALGLVGFTVLSAAVATAGITDMLLHNRRRRNEWLAEKQAESARELAIAKQALDQGRASEDQMLLINRERVAEEAAEAKMNKPGIIKRTTSWMFGGLSQEEQKGGRLGAAASGSQSASDEVRQISSSLADEGKSVLQAVSNNVESHRREGEAVQELINPAGGPLDRRAQAVADAASRSWTSWITGR
ncbi:hypothetical protein M409DRAFT_22002 [Zasmidium cellare ATCC 36951]|uniref:Uncharacterized protein n=1 Tax=Zasmidium cellare ATCC 36951 TaxID=1080233 RepID=A0A6A6CL36_ZASCE|nr:uncharacterized protein M409DRAFT_22002 [Zasmidium cellare ATCC 36951]KAF2167855.1 hypothetical protein M409DRAFT_22002 [Zasmidium cellare ATCC 36951]